jgi:hypothetical protein
MLKKLVPKVLVAIQVLARGERLTKFWTPGYHPFSRSLILIQIIKGTALLGRFARERYE